MLFVFGGQKDAAQLPFNLRCIQFFYGDKCLTRPAIHVWYKKFAHGHESVVDEERLRAWSPCCFDDQCNDRNSRFSHAVRPAPACDGINV